MKKKKYIAKPSSHTGPRGGGKTVKTRTSSKTGDSVSIENSLSAHTMEKTIRNLWRSGLAIINSCPTKKAVITYEKKGIGTNASAETLKLAQPP